MNTLTQLDFESDAIKDENGIRKQPIIDSTTGGLKVILKYNLSPSNMDRPELTIDSATNALILNVVG